jgi:hypothetical protein
MPAKSNLPLLLGALWFSSFAAVLACYGQTAPAATPRAVPRDAVSDAAIEPGPVPPTPAAVIDIVEIQPFRLKTGYRYDWLQNRPLVSTGLLVVLKVDPRYVFPRDTAEPVLYAGDRTVQRLNQGHRSEHVIGIIPGEIDLASAPIWFGRPELPERVTPQSIRAERALADRAGIKAFSRDKIKGATRKAVEAEDLAALLAGPLQTSS